jgi:EEF1A lysine methyltransferase 4
MNTTPLPRNNKEYGSHAYWETRFAAEESFEWLLSYPQLAPQLEPLLDACQAGDNERAEIRILMVGCGNAPFSADMYHAGYTNITNIDYSETVIDSMKRRHAHLDPPMQWHVMDMTTMENDVHGPLDSGYYHVVIDKAAMDALMSKEMDVWNPNPDVVHASHQMCIQISRVLRPKGTMIQVSLAQPHFRVKYLLGQHFIQNFSTDHTSDPTGSNVDPNYSSLYGWTVRSESAGRDPNATDDNGGGCFGHYLYIMTKSL